MSKNQLFDCASNVKSKAIFGWGWCNFLNVHKLIGCEEKIHSKEQNAPNATKTVFQTKKNFPHCWIECLMIGEQMFCSPMHREQDINHITFCKNVHDKLFLNCVMRKFWSCHDSFLGILVHCCFGCMGMNGPTWNKINCMQK